MINLEKAPLVTLENTRLTFNVEMYNLGTGKYDGFLLTDMDDYETFMETFNPYDNDCEIEVVTVDKIGTYTEYYNLSMNQLIEIMETVGTFSEFQKFDMIYATLGNLDESLSTYRNEAYSIYEATNNRTLAFDVVHDYGYITDDTPSVIKDCFDYEYYYSHYVEMDYTIGKFDNHKFIKENGFDTRVYTYLLIPNC